MSYHEAIADGIPIRVDRAGFDQYCPPCRLCGSPVPSWSYISGTQYTCRKCREIMVIENVKKETETSSDKQCARLERAIKRISKVSNIEPYSEGIAWIKGQLGRKGYFQSTEEVMVALELIRRGITACHQVAVHNYKVDFVIADLKVALEIDGAIYHGKDRIKREQQRDEVIVYKLGEGWELIRISTDNINKNITKLIPAIKAILAKRKEMLCRC